MIRVLVAASSVVMRAGLETLLSGNPDLVVVGSSSTVPLAQQVEELQPDVLVLEWEAIEDEVDWADLEARLTRVAIVALVDEIQEVALSESLRTQVRGILPIEASASEILATVEAAAVGLIVLHPAIAEALLPLPAPARTLPTVANQALTVREIEVLGMLAEGLGNKAIAKRLGISDHTVKFHVASIFSKLNASSRTEAVMVGARQGLILL